MFFFKKALWIFGILTLIYAGGSGTQSNSLIMQGMGFFGLIIAIVVLYVFGRMMWKGLGCFPSFLIFMSVLIFMMYALGMFNNGLGGVKGAVTKFIGYEGDAEQRIIQPEEQAEAEDEDEEITPMPAEEEVEDIKPVGSESAASPRLFGSEEPEPEEKPKQGIAEKMISSLMGDAKKEQPKQFNPANYPVVYGSVRVISGDTLEMYGRIFQLFGVAAPAVNQTCANRQGRAYNCGREAAAWLKNWIEDAELECRVIQQDTKGNMIGTCSYGPYDLGAALVNSGWAVAYTKYTDVYYPYEIQAQQNRRGLWQGTFYKPWDWKKLQQRQPKIKVIRPKTRHQGIFG